MKKKFTFGVVTLLFVSVAMWAVSPVSLHVHQSAGSIYSAALQDVVKLDFDVGDLVVQTASAQKFPLSGIRKVTFDRPSTGVHDVVATDCKIFVNADNVLIARAEQPICNLQVISLTGQVMFANQYAGQLYEVVENIHSLMQGTYLVLLQTTTGTANAKVMIR